MATKIEARAGYGHPTTISDPLEAISERRWFTLGSLIATVLVWTQVSNAVAWVGFLAVLASMLVWIIYGNARATRSISGAAGFTVACLAALVALGAAAAAAISYGERTAAPSWAYATIGVAVLSAVFWAAWRITAPLRSNAGN